MSIDINEYNLPDIEIFKNPHSSYDFSIWQPDATYLVLGQSNTIEKSLYTELVEADNIPVLKRPSGGETVILTPKTLVISAVFMNQKLTNPHQYFSVFNELIINGLLLAGIENIDHKGFSDLAIDDKKILGSSIYHKRDKIFYHAVLNVAESIETIEKYIRHPQKEPDYRKGRNHSEFVTSLVQHYPDLSVYNVIEGLTSALKKFA